MRWDDRLVGMTALQNLSTVIARIFVECATAAAPVAGAYVEDPA